MLAASKHSTKLFLEVFACSTRLQFPRHTGVYSTNDSFRTHASEHRKKLPFGAKRGAWLANVARAQVTVEHNSARVCASHNTTYNNYNSPPNTLLY